MSPLGNKNPFTQGHVLLLLAVWNPRICVNRILLLVYLSVILSILTHPLTHPHISLTKNTSTMNPSPSQFPTSPPSSHPYSRLSNPSTGMHALRAHILRHPRAQ